MEAPRLQANNMVVDIPVEPPRLQFIEVVGVIFLVVQRQIPMLDQFRASSNENHGLPLAGMSF